MAKTRHTTIRLHPDLEREAKEYARQTSQTFTQVVESAIAEYIKGGKRNSRHQKIVLPVAGGPDEPQMTLEEYQQLIDRMYDEEVEWHNRLIEDAR